MWLKPGESLACQRIKTQFWLSLVSAEINGDKWQLEICLCSHVRESSVSENCRLRWCRFRGWFQFGPELIEHHSRQAVKALQTRTHCCGHIVADTNVSPFARARNICCGHQFCVRDTKNVSDFVQKHFVSAANVSQFAQPKKHAQQCVLVWHKQSHQHCSFNSFSSQLNKLYLINFHCTLNLI